MRTSLKQRSQDVYKRQAKYHLHLAHLYGDLLNTYGDIGNIIALKYYAKQMDTDIQVDVVSIEDDFDPDQFDIAFFGGGQDYEQMVVSKDIQTKKDGIKKFIEDGKPMLAICGGYQLLGKYYVCLLYTSRRPRHDQLGLDFLSLSQDGVVIQFLGFGTEFVTVGVVKLPGEINLGTVG